MARVITARDVDDLTGMHRYWAYCALDCCVTRDVFDALHPRLNDHTSHIYNFEMGLQAPAMAMMFRGVQVNDRARLEAIDMLKKDFIAADDALQLLVEPYWKGMTVETGICPANDGKRHQWPRGVPDGDPTKVCKLCSAPRATRLRFNPMSDTQGSKLFYTDINMPEMYNKQGRVSVDKEVLDRIANKYPKYAAIARGIRECRGIRKQIGVLSSSISSDGRMRSTFNVGGPETGRFSSHDSPLGEGTNLQNITEKLRYIFEADRGYVMFYADLEQAESNAVAHLAQDDAYIDAHKSGDVHTVVTRMVWPELPWNGDMAKDKALAEELHPDWDPEHSYRYNAKRMQHGSNYLLSAAGMSRLAHVPQRAAHEFQDRYFDRFRGIPLWHREVNDKLKTSGVIVSPLGRQRQFFGRLWDPHTIKQAVAQDPQSMVADLLNTALWHVWHELDPTDVLLLAQVHDAILGGIRVLRGAAGASGDKKTLDRVLALMRVPVLVHGREMVIGTDVKIGKNWGKYNDNPARGRLNLEGMR